MVVGHSRTKHQLKCYRMSTSSYVGGITSACKLTFYDSSDTSRVSLEIGEYGVQV